MTTAAKVIGYQAMLLDEFRTPDPAGQGIEIAVTNGDGTQFRVPISKMGQCLDLVMFGRAADPAALLRHPDGTTTTSPEAATIAPLVASGLASCRAYRVQENMTAAIVARSDAMPEPTVLGMPDDDGDPGIMPPRPSGFVWFERPVPYFDKPLGSTNGEPGVGLLTWVAVADAIVGGRPTDMAWVAVVWDDMWRSPWQDGGTWPVVNPKSGSRFVPVTALALRPGRQLTGGPVKAARKLGDRPIRNPEYLVAALWQMLGETIPAIRGEHTETVEQADEAVDRRAQRRARIAGMDVEPAVTTVVLRRERREVQNPGTGRPHESRLWIEPYSGKRWIGSTARGDRQLVTRTISGHWSCKDEALPVRKRTVVSELRR